MRYRKVVIAALVSGLLALAGAQQAQAAALEWLPRQLRVHASAGTTSESAARFTYSGHDIKNPRAEVSGPVRSMVSVRVDGMRPADGGGYELPLTITVHAGATGHLSGSLRLRDGNRLLGPALPVRVDVVAPGAIKTEPARPSADRIGPGPQGVLVVLDELVVGVSNSPAQNAVAMAAATATGGQIIGSAPALGLYQIHYPGSSLAATIARIPAAESVAGVDFAHLNVVDADEEETIPDDTEWDDWDVAAPGGNNWGLEWIDAPGAWDATTGSSAIRVGVIDTDNDEDHGDLDDNVVNTSRGPKSSGHGTHVAGTACAEGDNDKGVTGLMWDCELRFYYYGGDTVSTADRMRQAVDDGNRVVNMSLQFIENNTEIVITDDIVELVDDTNDIFGRALLYAQRQDRDVLWVFAAGNETERDVRFTAPGGLAVRFPTNSMAVAAIGRDGDLADFSNTGDAVSVAAPGVDIYSTLPREGCWIFTIGCDDRYGFKNGTSMAAPHVTGLAGLVLADDPSRTAAEVKRCIQAGAERDGTPVPGQPFSVIDAPAAVACEGTIDLPPVVDVVLSFDLTGSMGGVLDQAKTEMQRAINDVAAAAPGSDIRYSVVSYEDYPGFLDSRPCGSGYAATYGVPTDEPFRVDASSTGDAATTQATIGGLALGNGFDGPESYGRALWEIAQPDTAAALGLRPDALVLVINFGDNVPHDRDVNAGVEGVSGVSDTGIDPGRNGVVDCGGDDIDFQDDALAELTEAGVRLLHVDSGPFEAHWRTWTSMTGGAYTSLGGRSLSEVVVELLALV